MLLDEAGNLRQGFGSDTASNEQLREEAYQSDDLHEAPKGEEDTKDHLG